MKLYGSLISPYARKCSILARLFNLDVEEIGVSADGVNGYTGGVNPVGKIPALVRDGKPVMVESHIICEFFDSLNVKAGGKALLPASGEPRWTQMRLHALGNSIGDCAYDYRYETVRPPALHWADMIARKETGLRTIVSALEAEVESLGTPWAWGNLAIVTGLDYADYRGGHIDWRALAPKLAKWHEQFKHDPVWQKTYAYPSS